MGHPTMQENDTAKLTPTFLPQRLVKITLLKSKISLKLAISRKKRNINRLKTATYEKFKF